MPHRSLVSAALPALIVAMCPAVELLTAQAPPAKSFTPPPSTYNPPRTPWGDPDLMGVWDYQSVIRMERPDNLAGKARFANNAEYEAWARANAPNRDNEKGVGAYNEFWNDRNFVRNLNTSLIVDPPDGRYPPLTPAAEQRQKEILAKASELASWEDYHAFGAMHRVADAERATGVQQRHVHHAVAGMGADCPGAVGHAHHPARWAPAYRPEHPPLERRPGRPLGRQHAGRRNHQFHGQAAPGRRFRGEHSRGHPIRELSSDRSTSCRSAAIESSTTRRSTTPRRGPDPGRSICHGRGMTTTRFSSMRATRATTPWRTHSAESACSKPRPRRNARPGNNAARSGRAKNRRGDTAAITVR